MGMVPVSGSIVPANARAFLWTPAGMVDLNTYLPTLGINLTGWDGLTGWLERLAERPAIAAELHVVAAL